MIEPKHFTDAEIEACIRQLGDAYYRTLEVTQVCAFAMLRFLLAERRARAEADARALAGAPEVVRELVDAMRKWAGDGAFVTLPNGETIAHLYIRQADAILALLRSHEQHEAEKRAVAERVQKAAMDALDPPYYTKINKMTMDIARGRILDCIDIDALLAKETK